MGTHKQDLIRYKPWYSGNIMGMYWEYDGKLNGEVSNLEAPYVQTVNSCRGQNVLVARPGTTKGW